MNTEKEYVLEMKEITIPFCLLQLILMITYKKLEIGEKAHPVDFGWAFSATERGNFNEHRKRVCS